MPDQFSEAFIRAMELAEFLGVSKINQLPECWEHQLDDDWRIAINGHNREATAFEQATVPPFTLYAECRGWPAAFIDPYGGHIIGAQEDALIDALVKAKAPA